MTNHRLRKISVMHMKALLTMKDIFKVVFLIYKEELFEIDEKAQ